MMRPKSLFCVKILFFLGLILPVTTSFSQSYTNRKTVTGKAKTFFEAGQKLSTKGDYGRAIVAYSNAFKADSTFVDAVIWIAGCHLELKNLAAAEASFERATQIAPDYEPLVWFNLATVERDQKKYLEAADHADRFLTYPKISLALKSEMARLAQNGRFAAKATLNPVKFDPKPLPKSINTPASEYMPTITGDGETMIFCRYKTDENFFVSQKIDSNWQIATPLDRINTSENEGTQSLSIDGKYLYFTACGRKSDGLGSCDLYFSSQNAGNWSKPINLGATVNTRNWDSQPSISADGRTLYFASDRTDGWGGKDIWLTKKGSDERWSAPQNIGAPINTLGNEMAPFLHPDGQTLYFMSDGLPGMGVGPGSTFDIFMSRKKADDTWSTPENLGFPINSIGNEGAFYVSLDGKTAYFAAQNRPEGQGNDDIYSFELAENLRPQPMTYAKARIRDYENFQPLTAQANFTNLADGKTWFSGATAADGTFLVCLPVGGNFALLVNKKGYLFHSENFNLSNFATADKPFVLDILLKKILENDPKTAQKATENNPVLGKTIVLKNIFFETNSAILTPESTPELMNLKIFLVENPSIKIRLNGHTDNVGTDSENQMLSENRAKAVFDFLVKNGLEPTRLAFRGFGESAPISTNETPAGRAENRRTEFELQ